MNCISKLVIVLHGVVFAMICDVTIVGFTILDVVAKINLFSLFCTALFTSHVSQLTPLPLGI